MNTIDVLSIIGKENDNIDSFSFHTFPKQILLQDKLSNWGKVEQAHFEKAMELREQLHLPFWDAIMISTFSTFTYSTAILKMALLHNHIENIYYVKSTDIQQNRFSYNNDKRMAVCSSVIMKDGSIRHIPMLDFHIPISDNNFHVVKEVCTMFNLHSGFILNSGESYHFIASYTTTWDNLYTMLSQALLFCPILDRAWISHQLQEKSCSLRIDKKNGIETFVIKILK